MKKLALIACIAAVATPAMAPSAWAKTPEPAKAVLPSFFTGRWYEIVRTPNMNQRDCEAPTYQFGAKSAEKIDFVLTCHRGSPEGKPVAKTVTLHIPQDDQRNKFRVSAGIISVNYIVLDRAADQSWAILGTDGGHYVWLLARKPDMGDGEKATITAKLKSLGYAKLEEPKQG
jgi:apolipoprotein D and lipocalin family protein